MIGQPRNHHFIRLQTLKEIKNLKFNLQIINKWFKSGSRCSTLGLLCIWTHSLMTNSHFLGTFFTKQGRRVFMKKFSTFPYLSSPLPLNSGFLRSIDKRVQITKTLCQKNIKKANSSIFDLLSCSANIYFSSALFWVI